MDIYKPHHQFTQIKSVLDLFSQDKKERCLQGDSLGHLGEIHLMVKKGKEKMNSDLQIIKEGDGFIGKGFR